ncbi:hypothetical protein MBM_07138 [Drepanopeziza brunnea f. sp. 'multigermtubi' MB_m1]|uniref:Uncharacterized protein n=1 Tax=Marssonina brunnea f. sp. multigermtubi (strain MB_m1) TaxID=1072389 RepID=K1WR96_MARBU|nr:uncharacterized protein MBM_07138 [Drepanopeziza brunnea f. sp. 'multigermtubi' MB_m1]EKD14927.1 hypothetical protein MBM_07138 [Drepanopeziza brunnea f. sp. 'multigermtubi' MB_m1]
MVDDPLSPGGKCLDECTLLARSVIWRSHDPRNKDNTTAGAPTDNATAANASAKDAVMSQGQGGLPLQSSTGIIARLFHDQAGNLYGVWWYDQDLCGWIGFSYNYSAVLEDGKLENGVSCSEFAHTVISRLLPISRWGGTNESSWALVVKIEEEIYGDEPFAQGRNRQADDSVDAEGLQKFDQTLRLPPIHFHNGFRKSGELEWYQESISPSA